MHFLLRGTRHIFRVSPKIYSDTFCRLSGEGISILADARSTDSSVKATHRICWSLDFAGCQRHRYGTFPKAKHQKPSRHILSFIRSSLNHPRGHSHCWLNASADIKNLFKEDNIFLVLVGEYFESSLEANQNAVKMFQKAKSLQQRHPSLQVLALQCCNSTCLTDISPNGLWKIMKEYVTFPILLSNKNSFEMESVPCYIISKGLQKHMVHPGDDVDIKLLDKAIHNLNLQNDKGTNSDNLKSSWVKPSSVVKEPDTCLALRHLLFSFPGCISVDENGHRFFLSDVNHHRIVVFNIYGEALDAIGSSPGFEDGDFESAKLLRPAASMYHASEDLLFFVDSEGICSAFVRSYSGGSIKPSDVEPLLQSLTRIHANHAIRRADMEKRVVVTVFPSTDDSKKNKGLWKWIVDTIWSKRNIKLKSEELNSDSFLFPWHLLKSQNNDLFVLSQSFETLWIIDMELGFIREVVKESSKIMEICRQIILEKCVPLSHLPAAWLQQVDPSCPIKEIPYASLMSSVAAYQDNIIFCDSVGQTVVQFSEGSESPGSFQFSNFGVLGVPYWLISSLEGIYTVDHLLGVDVDHSQTFDLLPGTVNIQLSVHIPRDTDLVEHPQEGCIWRQARGAAIEVSTVDNKASSSEKIGLAQQWYDEIDSLSFSKPEEESSKDEDNPVIEEVQDGRVRIGCTINTSPGTSEAIIHAALYLRLSRNSSLNSRAEKAARIANILEHKRKSRKDLLVKLLMATQSNLEEIIFTRPLHVILKFNTGDHPKAENTKAIILTDSTVEVHVTL